MEKRPFVTKEQLESIAEKYPTPFHLYDERGIRENARRMNAAFSWNKGFREYFAVKATPNPVIMKILKEEGCGVDCSSYTELMLSEACGFVGQDIMFSSNDTPAEDFRLARKMNVIINLDDLTHVEALREAAGIPKTICCRYNPGGVFETANGIMDNPGDAKYGMTYDQTVTAYKELRALGATDFGIHAFLASNTQTEDYYPELARILFRTAVALRDETGANI
ncbi:MAG: diaminopimelate decarboxylase, partial [Christensenella sp.]